MCAPSVPYDDYNIVGIPLTDSRVPEVIECVT